MPTVYDHTRPYLVIPKLIEQPTWGGTYIAHTKGWRDRPGLDCKIGQSYELFSGSNLSLLTDSQDPRFAGELTDRDAVQAQTHPADSVALADLIASDPQATLGRSHATERGNSLGLLAKFTQALGNSFQVHIAAGSMHPRWHQKPESWYFFEPGKLTLGVRPAIDWDAYKQAVTAVHQGMAIIGQQIKSGAMSSDDSQLPIQELLRRHDPWQYVNAVEAEADQLIDLSAGGLHHSWEEDTHHAPHGNVLYELQTDVMDDVSTLRCFDKGKISADGTIRDVHIDDYFALIDRSAEANNPQRHIKQPVVLAEGPGFVLQQLLRSPFYNLDKLTLATSNVIFTDPPAGFKHLFVKEGAARVSAGRHSVHVTRGHSCFVPAKAAMLEVTSQADDTQILISY